jgi:hypothetical protein
MQTYDLGKGSILGLLREAGVRTRAKGLHPTNSPLVPDASGRPLRLQRRDGPAGSHGRRCDLAETLEGGTGLTPETSPGADRLPS